MADYVNITINDKPIQARVGETILHVCLDQGIEIPHLCHDPKLKPFAACYVCVVEIKGYKTHQPSCSTVVQEGMEIYTDTPEIKKSRKNALELLLSNHYADCLAPCSQACPAGVDIQGYLSLTEKGLFQQAVELIKETNPLPAICGRVCVRPCEDHCRRALTEDNSPVGIDYLKRFIADFDLVSESPVTPKIKPLNGKKVAIIGSGPAGLTTAYYLQIEGIQADIYERAPKTGGWLRYGIPEYRLPNNIIDQEVANITKLGVKIFTQQELSKNLRFETLDKEYDAIFLGIGAQVGDLLGIGEKSAPNLISGIDFLKKNAETNNNTDLSGKKVVVIGGGNTAMDCCRTALRCGSEDVWVLYRRTEADMPANPIEIHESKVEGVQYQFLTTPIDVYYDNEGNLTGLKCIRMKAEKKEGSRRSTITPIEGSEFDVACDLVLPATGQKLESHVLEHINDYYKTESLRLNRWNTLEPDHHTQQMNIPKIFAAGDVVTGPTNIIEAIAGGKRAANAITQYVLGESLRMSFPQFISSKENFTKQVSEQYCGKYTPTTKNEMPVLSEKERHNFEEVELGYQTIEQVTSEVSRCLECGCSAFYDCDLQKYATQYGADQTRFKGTYQTFETHSVHPKLVLDNHKCILCGRCVRVCNEYSGNRVWGFLKRGYKTYIAPNLEGNLLESRCDACGLCVDTCPTGALTENYIFKVLPVPYNHLPTIDPFGSEGFEVDLLEYKGNIYGATSRRGVVNQKGLINRDIFFNYSLFNKSNRITQPMEKIDGVWEAISIERALERIKEETQKVKNENNFIWISPEFTNEAIYMIQKWGRAALLSNTIGSSYFQNRSQLSNPDKNDILPLSELDDSHQIFIIGGSLPESHPVISHLLQNSRFHNRATLILITTNPKDKYALRVDTTHYIKDYYTFIKAINHYLITYDKAFGIFVEGLASHKTEYFEHISSLDADELYSKAGVSFEVIQQIAEQILEIPETALIMSEYEIDEKTLVEAHNLMLLTEKQGKPSAGIINLRPSCNTQGLYDMGAMSEYGPGNRKIEGEYLDLLQETWGNIKLSSHFNSLENQIQSEENKNFFIFGDDPIKADPTIIPHFEKAQFVMLQTTFKNETTLYADLMIPANFGIELGGSYTSSFKVAQSFKAVKKPTIKWNDYQFYAKLHEVFGIETPSNSSDIFFEMLSFLQPDCCSGGRHHFKITK